MYYVPNMGLLVYILRKTDGQLLVVTLNKLIRNKPIEIDDIDR